MLSAPTYETRRSCFGNSGSITAHNSSLTSHGFRRAMVMLIDWCCRFRPCSATVRQPWQAAQDRLRLGLAGPPGRGDTCLPWNA